MPLPPSNFIRIREETFRWMQWCNPTPAMARAKYYRDRTATVAKLGRFIKDVKRMSIVWITVNLFGLQAQDGGCWTRAAVYLTARQISATPIANRSARRARLKVSWLTRSCAFKPK